MTFTEKMACEMKRLEQLKQVKILPEDQYRFRQIDFATLVDALQKPQRSKLLGCQVPLITTAIFKPAPKPLKVK
jgi:hypothetical protein